METLRTYLSTLSPAAQADFAVRAGTSIGYLRKAISVGQRFDGALVRLLHIESSGAVSLTDLRPDIWPAGEALLISRPVQIKASIDSRMSKRALRSLLGLASDAHLATVLGLPAGEVEAWPEHGRVPELPQVLKLVSADEVPAALSQAVDPDAGRIVGVEST